MEGLILWDDGQSEVRLNDLLTKPFRSSLDHREENRRSLHLFVVIRT
jgi:hypothetical protein